MANEQDDDMYLFNGDMGQTPNAYAGPAFDSFLEGSAAQEDEDMDTGYLNPDDLAIKREYNASPRADPVFTRASTSSASSSDSSDSPQHNRNVSTATTTSPAMSKNEMWNTGINGMSMPMNEQYYENISMAAIDQDLDQQMASAFDFETAASTPSGYDAASMNSGRSFAGNPQVRRAATMMNMNNSRHRHPSPRVTAAPASFFLGSREASPLNSTLPASQAPSPWHKHSPSSGLEETFHHMGMNGDSPGNATFSPNMHINYADAQFSFAPDSTGTPSSFAKDISSPPSTVHSFDGQPTLQIYPTSLKSRVETQIPIKMILNPLPTGIRKMRLPTHTVSKPKFLAKPDIERSPDTLELSVSLVCTSAMQDRHRKQRALARARGEDTSGYSRPSPASSTGSASSKDDDEKPLNGGEVKICSGCIQRERKRASRKKQKKPEEEELFQKDEEKRVVVFNTNQVKEWIEVTKETQAANESSPLPPPGTVQVELPMRIACYCRHQNEKLGFQVIFTVKDFRDKVIAQAMTNSIMITDDHKTHNAPQPLSAGQPSQSSQPTHFPGAGVFTAGQDMPSNEAPGMKLFKQSYSTPDLTRLQQPGFNGHYGGPNSTPFAVPQAVSGNTSATLTPRNLSRPASPSGPSGPATKRRKPSGSGKLPSGLTMTRLDTMPQTIGPSTMPNTAASSPYAPNMPNFMAGPDNRFAQSQPRNQPTMHPSTFNSPPTPGGDGTFSNINRSFSLENIPSRVLISAPSSRQPSRPGSPLSQTSFPQNDANFGQAVNQQLMGQSSRRPIPVIHKLVPAEGSVSGGTEVTLLGNGFYQGLEVMFGDTEATTTTFWGEKCLNCIAPPAVSPGMVAVVFKHEHPHYSAVQSTSHVRHSFFTYVDDREIEMLRLALRTIGKQMGTDDPMHAAQQLLQQNQGAGNAMYQQQGPYGGMMNGHQRAVSGLGSQNFAPQEMELCLLRMLRLAVRQVGSSPIQLDLRRPSGLTLLHLAASLAMPKLLRALVSAGADANAFDNNGFTPMHHAAMNGHEHIISQLRVAGADHRLRSIRNFVPADLATTLQAYQATMRPYQHTRSRSSGASTLTMSSRNASSKSLSSFWEGSSTQQTGSESEVTEDGNLSRVATHSRASSQRLPFAQPVLSSAQTSRRGSGQEFAPSQALVQTVRQPQDQPTSPSTLMNAWRQLVNMTQFQQAQLTEQIHHLQDNMPALPQLDYQNNGMVRRMSALFPQRSQSMTPSTNQQQRSSSPIISAPPSYDELYPEAPSTYSADKKEASVVQAAAEAAIDQHFSQQEASDTSALAQKAGSAANDQHKQRPHRGVSQDLRLFMFWLPLLLVLIGLIIPNSPIAHIASTITDRYIAPRMVPVV